MRLRLLVKNVHNLPEDFCIIVHFDKEHAAIREAVGLLAGVCGQLATDCVRLFFKINGIAQFCFKECDVLVKRFLLQLFGRKSREHRIKLCNDFYDPRLSKNQIINNGPENIVPDQWTLFVKYRLKSETQVIIILLLIIFKSKSDALTLCTCNSLEYLQHELWITFFCPIL
ncbi:hypothetical protein AHAS_Ahas07G0112100 [Arachis hypogaea]